VVVGLAMVFSASAIVAQERFPTRSSAVRPAGPLPGSSSWSPS
jgi:hypothetical protein